MRLPLRHGQREWRCAEARTAPANAEYRLSWAGGFRANARSGRDRAPGVLIDFPTSAVGEFGLEGPERALPQAVELVITGYGTVLRSAFVPVACVLFFLTGSLWALAYALWIEPRLPGRDWLKGMAFSLLPTLVSWLIVLPPLGAGPGSRTARSPRQGASPLIAPTRGCRAGALQPMVLR